MPWILNEDFSSDDDVDYDDDANTTENTTTTKVTMTHNCFRSFWVLLIIK